MSKCEEKTVLNIKQMSSIFNKFVSVQQIGSKIGFCINITLRAKSLH